MEAPDLNLFPMLRCYDVFTARWWALRAGTQTYLVHKRLSIVAPGESGDQPLFTDPTTKKLAFIANGRAVT